MKSRKINKAKHYCNSCRNNGSCVYCRDSRTHSNRRREPIVEELVDELAEAIERLEGARISGDGPAIERAEEELYEVESRLDHLTGEGL